MVTALQATYTAQLTAALANVQALQVVIEDMPVPNGKTQIISNSKLFDRRARLLVQINEQLGHLLRFAIEN